MTRNIHADVVEFLRDAAHEAAQEDRSVGIFGDQELADALRELADFVEVKHLEVNQNAFVAWLRRWGW